jgi:hypothetical protein
MPTRREADHKPPAPSPLLLCDRLLRLAEDADRAGVSAAMKNRAYLARLP